MTDKKTPIEWYRWVQNDLEGNYYALCIDTDLYEPAFPLNSLLRVNSDLIPDDRSFIVIKKKNNPSHYSIKKYVIDGNAIYLYPINPKLAVEVYDESLYNIAGVVLEVHQKLRSKK
jgi:SOS-response transcriptional repressor LexA